MADELSILLKSKIDDSNKSINDLIKQINTISKNLESIALKVKFDDKSIKALENSINNLQKNIKFAPQIDASKLKNAQVKIEKIFGKTIKFNPEIQTQGIEDFKKRVAEIRDNIDKLANVQINTTKNGGIKSALITYKNEMGQVVQETMTWEKHLNETGDTLKRVFKTTNIKYVDNIEKATKAQQKLNNELLKQQKFINKKTTQLFGYGNEINNLSITKGLDSTKFKSDIEDISKLLIKLQTMQFGTIEYKKTEDSINRMTASLKEKINIEKQDLDLAKKKEIIYAKINDKIAYMNDITVKNDKYDETEFSKLKKDFEGIATAVKTGTMSYDEADIKINKLSSNLKNFEVNAKKASNTTNAFSATFKRFLSYFSIYKVINLTTRTVKEMAKTVSELDSALVDLQKVSNLAGNSLKEFTKQAYQVGKEISKSGKEVIQASTEFAKAGYGEEELLSLAKSALILTSIGDGITNVSESANTLISVLKGYKKDTSEIQHVLDAINNVSNNCAVSFSDITTALQRVSGVMSASNIDMEKSIGMFTAINEVLRNTEMTATSLNSISFRMRGLEEDGTAIDGLVPKLQKVYKEIADIDITDKNGQVEDLYTIISKLAPKWKELTDNQKQYLASQSAGLRQSKSFLILVENFNRAIEATNLAYNSSGSAMEEFTKWQDSIEGRMNNLKSAFEQFSTTTLNSDFIKSLLNITSGIVNFGTACGGAVPFISAFIVAFTGLKLINMAKTAEDLTKVSFGFEKLVGVIKIAGVTKTALVIGAIATAIIGLSAVITKFSNSSKKAIEAYKKIESELESVNNELKTTSQRIDELNNKDKLTFVEKDELKNLEETNRELNKRKVLLEDITKNKAEVADKKIISETDDKYFNNYNHSDREYSNYASGDYKTHKTIGRGYTSIVITDDEYYKRVIKRYEELSNLNREFTDDEIEEYKKLNGYITESAKGYQDQSDKLVGATNESKKYKEELLNLADAGYKVLHPDLWKKDNLTEIFSKPQFLQLKDTFTELNKENKLDENVINSYKSFSEELQKVGLTATDVLVNIEDLINSENNLQINTDELTESVEDFTKAISEIDSAKNTLSKLEDIFETLNSKGALSADNMTELLNISEEYMFILNDEEALRSKLSEDIEDYKTSILDTYKNALISSERYYNYLKNNDGSTLNRIEANLQKHFDERNKTYKVDLKNYRTIEEAKLDISRKLISQLAGSWVKYFNAEGDILLKSGNVEQDVELLKLLGKDRANKQLSSLEKDIKNRLAEIAKEFEFDINLDTVDFSNKSSSSSSTANDDISKIYNQRIDFLNQQIFLSQQLQKTFEEGSDAWQKEIDKQNELYKTKMDLSHEEAERLRKLGYDENSSEVFGKKQNWWGDYDSYAENLQKTLDGMTLTYEEQNKLIEDRIRLLELEQSKLNDNDPQQRALEEEKLALINKKEDILKAQMDKVRKSNIKGWEKEYDELANHIVDLMEEKVASIKAIKVFDTENLQYQIDKIEEFKSNYSKLQSYYTSMRKRQLKETKGMYEKEKEWQNEVLQNKINAINKEREIKQNQNDIEEKTRKISEIQSEMDLIKNDKTQIARYRQLQEELVEAQKDLTQEQEDQTYERRIEALEEEKKRIDEEYSYKIEKLEEYINDEERLIEEFNDKWGKDNKALFDSLIQEAEKYNTFTTEELSTAWETCTTALSDFNLKQEDINNSFKDMQERLISIKKLLKEINEMSIDDFEGKIVSNGGSIPKHHSGVYAGVVGGNKYSTNSMEQLTKLLKGELVINTNQANKFINDTLPKISGQPITINQGDIIISGNPDKSVVNEVKGLLNKQAQEFKKMLGRGNITNFATQL